MLPNVLWTFVGFLFLLTFFLALSSIKIVKQSQIAVIERLGKFHRMGQSGLNFVIPIFDRVMKHVDLRVQVIDSKPQPVITKDNVTMTIDTVVYYRITDAFKAMYEISNLVQAIQYLTTTSLRDVIGTMELDSTLASRDAINSKLRFMLDEATDQWGVRVDRVEVKDINPPKDIQEAMEKQMRAEREKRASILKAQGEKEAAITTAEGLKEAAILNAQAEQQSAILRADAAKEAAIRKAEGEATAIKMVAEADAIKIQMIYDALKAADLDEKVLTLKSIEALIKMAEGENKVFVPYEAQNILANVGAIQELLAGNKSK